MNNVININKDIADRRYITAKGLQEIFIGLGRSTVDDWAKQGLLNRHKIGGTVFYKLSEVDSLIENSREYRKVK